MQFHCASCGREIVSRYDGWLAIRGESLVPVLRKTAWMIHEWCQHNWQEEYPGEWRYLPLKRMVEAKQGGR